MQVLKNTFQFDIICYYSHSVVYMGFWGFGESNIDLRFTKVESMISNQISEAKSDLTKWMFIFWASQMTITLGILLLILNK